MSFDNRFKYLDFQDVKPWWTVFVATAVGEEKVTDAFLNQEIAANLVFNNSMYLLTFAHRVCCEGMGPRGGSWVSVGHSVYPSLDTSVDIRGAV